MLKLEGYGMILLGRLGYRFKVRRLGYRLKFKDYVIGY